MPWVQEELRHDHLIDDLWTVVLRRFEDEAGNKWWVDFNTEIEKLDLWKVVYEPGLFSVNGNGDYIPNYTMEDVEEGGMIAITRHTIIKRWDGQLLGLAQSTGALKFFPLEYSDDAATFLAELQKTFYDTVDYTTLYTYMLDEYLHYTHHVTDDGDVMPITYIVEDTGVGVARSSLDIEFHTEDVYEPTMYQSPVMAIDLIHGRTYNVGIIGKLNYKTDTNWWDDSKIKVFGNVDSRSFCLILRADTAPHWHDNKVPQTPFFFGDLVLRDGKTYPVAMFGGKAVDKFFDFDSSVVTEDTAIMPVTRNYINYPGNGVDNVILKRTKYGARYQAHYLSWETPPNEIPPKRYVLEFTPDVIEKMEITRDSKNSEAIGLDTYSIKLVSKNPDRKEVHYYAGCSYLVIDDKEICEITAINVETNSLIVRRENPQEFPQGIVVKGLTEEAVEAIKKKGVRAWNNLRQGYSGFTPHPSRYSGKVHTSRVYLVHPEDGVVGQLPNMVATYSVNIYDGTKLVFERHCEECATDAYEPEAPESAGITMWTPYPNSETEAGKPDPGEGGGTTPGGDGGGSITPPTTPEEENYQPKPPSTSCDIFTPEKRAEIEGTSPFVWDATDNLEAVAQQDIGKGIKGKKYVEGRNNLMEVIYTSVLDDAGKQSQGYLTKGLSVDGTNKLVQILPDVVTITNIAEDWQKFRMTDFAKYGVMDCTSDAQRASIYATSKLGMYVQVHEDSKSFAAGLVLDEMVDRFKEMDIKNLVDGLSFRDIQPDSGNTITGAFVFDINTPDFKTMLGFMNIEPQLLLYDFESSEFFNPVDYIKLGDGFSDYQIVPNADYDVYKQGEGLTAVEKLAKVAGSVAVHELAHAIDNLHYDLFGERLTDQQGWLNLSGWGPKTGGSYAELKKANPGRLADSGKPAPVTLYGCTSPAEDYAEAYAMYKYNPDFLKYLHKEKYDYIVAKDQEIHAAT